jgi:hypothetical protein
MFTGQQCFDLFVSVGLCTSFIYEWEKLSIEMQTRWNRFAQTLNEIAASPKP